MDREAADEPSDAARDAVSRASPRPAVLPPSSAVSATELEADRWVLLAPPTRRFTVAFRAVAVLFAALSVTGVVLGGDLVEVDRSGWRWALLIGGVGLSALGLVCTWRAARLPRPIDSELYRLGPWTGPERRRISRLLRHRAPLTSTDRPTAAAYVAGMQTYRLPAANSVGLIGLQLVLQADVLSPDDPMTLLVLASFAAAALLGLLAVGIAHTTLQAAHHAGVAPLTRGC